MSNFQKECIYQPVPQCHINDSTQYLTLLLVHYGMLMLKLPCFTTDVISISAHALCSKHGCLLCKSPTDVSPGALWSNVVPRLVLPPIETNCCSALVVCAILVVTGPY